MVRSFNGGLAGFKLGAKCGFMDENGQEVIAAKFDDIWAFYNGLAPVKVAQGWGFIDKTGKMVIEPKCQSISQRVNKVYVAKKIISGDFLQQ